MASSAVISEAVDRLLIKSIGFPFTAYMRGMLNFTILADWALLGPWENALKCDDPFDGFL